MNSPFLATAVVVFTASVFAQAAPPPISAKDVKVERELLITDTAVVDGEHAKYPGAFSFGKLMEELAPDGKGAEFTRNWLEMFSTTQNVNGQSVGLRPKTDELVIAEWQRRDGYDADSCETWTPKLEHAPFRLLAIVNRMDLGAPGLAEVEESERVKWRGAGSEEVFERLLESAMSGKPLDLRPRPPQFPPRQSAGGFGGWGGAIVAAPQTFVGEGRLVFGAVGADGRALPGGWTVIFEYRLPEIALAVLPEGTKRSGNGAHQLAQAWAMRWHALAALDPKEPSFADALAELTTAFTHKRPELRRAASLAQLRSNDGALGAGREFRQFEMNGDALKMVALPGTPMPVFHERGSNEMRALASFLREQTPLFRAGLGTLPENLQVRGNSVPLLTAAALIPAKEAEFHWEFGQAVPRETRRLMSLNTCNGCHAAETGSKDGMHVRPRDERTAAVLSPWLGAGPGGLRVDDPGFKNSRVDFREMDDRKAIFAALLAPRESKRLSALEKVLKQRLRRGH